MKEEKRILLVTENNEPLKIGNKCVFNGIKLITKEAESGCMGCWFFRNQPDCPCNVSCTSIIYIEDKD